MTVTGRYRALAALALLTFLFSNWMEPSQPVVNAWQSAPTDTSFPTETKESLITATYEPLTPTVTPFPATPTKSEGGIGGLGLVRQFYLPLISRSNEVIAPPTAPPTTTPLPTLTAPAPPPAVLSRYMSTDNIVSSNYNDMYTLGRQRGGCDGSPTPARPNSFLILAFGYPWDNHTPTSPASSYWVALYPVGAVKVRLDVLENNIFGFVRGYYNCVSVHNPSASLTVGLGINGSIADWLTFEHGRQWARMVDRLNNQQPSWQSTIKMVGAADFEPDWGNVARVRQWAEGYASVDYSKYYFYGACSGCPAVTRDAAGNYVANYTPVLVAESDWTMDDVWYLSYGVRPAYPLPEIYETSGAHARQWQNLSLWAATCNLIPYTTTQCEPQRRGVNRYMYFSGVMTQHQACIDIGYHPSCYPLLFNEPPVGWGQLWQALNNPNTPLTHQAALKWSTDISWQH